MRYGAEHVKARGRLLVVPLVPAAEGDAATLGHLGQLGTDGVLSLQASAIRPTRAPMSCPCSLFQVAKGKV